MKTFGPEACELAASAGLVADDWQADVMDAMLAVRPDGKWASFETGIIVSRQNGKGSIFEIRALAGLFLLDEQLILWSAHEVKTAMEGFRRIHRLIDGCADLRRRVKSVVTANGKEGLELKNGARLRFVARSKGSGRGFSGDVNLIDEAFAYTAEQQAALMPTASAMPNPQFVYASSPPLDALTGEPLYALKTRGETGEDKSLAWFDWGAPHDVDPDNRAEWARSNPALGIRITEETIERERASMTDDDFKRERLCVWPRREQDVKGVITVEQWQATADVDSQISGDFAIAVDITPSRDSAAIAVYGLRDDGLGHVEIIDQRPGVSWIVPALKTLHDKRDPVAIAVDSKGPAGSLKDELEKVGIDLPADKDRPRRGDLAIPDVSELTAATGLFVDAVRGGALRHRDQVELNLAVTGAATRPVGDAWLWARRVASVDISPLVAATLARWAFEKRQEAANREFNPGIYYL